MVKEWGMSDEIGVVFHSNGDHSSPATKDKIDREVQKLLTLSYERARHILQTNRKDLDTLAKALVEHETLSGAEIKDLLAGKKLRK